MKMDDLGVPLFRKHPYIGGLTLLITIVVGAKPCTFTPSTTQFCQVKVDVNAPLSGLWVCKPGTGDVSWKTRWYFRQNISSTPKNPDPSLE